MLNHHQYILEDDNRLIEEDLDIYDYELYSMLYEAGSASKAASASKKQAKGLFGRIRRWLSKGVLNSLKSRDTNRILLAYDEIVVSTVYGRDSVISKSLFDNISIHAKSYKTDSKKKFDDSESRRITNLSKSNRFLMDYIVSSNAVMNAITSIEVKDIKDNRKMGGSYLYGIKSLEYGMKNALNDITLRIGGFLYFKDAKDMLQYHENESRYSLFKYDEEAGEFDKSDFSEDITISHREQFYISVGRFMSMYYNAQQTEHYRNLIQKMLDATKQATKAADNSGPDDSMSPEELKNALDVVRYMAGPSLRGDSNDPGAIKTFRAYAENLIQTADTGVNSAIEKFKGLYENPENEPTNKIIGKKRYFKEEPLIKAWQTKRIVIQEAIDTFATAFYSLESFRRVQEFFQDMYPKIEEMFEIAIKHNQDRQQHQNNNNQSPV